MINIVAAENRERFSENINAMFADRKQVFVDILKWDLPVTEGLYEIDQFDNDDAVYLLAVDDSGAHLGSMRLLRTDQPHILGSLFPHLSDQGIPSGEDTLEITRLCLSPRLPARERRYVRDLLISTMTDYAILNGIATLTGVATANWLAKIQMMGWICETLAPPQAVAGVPTGAFRITIDGNTPADLARMGIYRTHTSDAYEARLHLNLAGTGFRSMPATLPDLAATAVQRLSAEGFCVIPDAIPLELVEGLNADLDARFAATPFCEGGFYGPRTKRFGSLLKRSAAAAEFVQHPLMLEIASRVLGPWCDRFNLNLTQAIEIHPGAPAQFPHRDQEMWQGEKGKIEYLLNVIWPLTEFTAENGATRIWPRSHRDGGTAQASHDKPVITEMTAGSALVFLGSTLHSAGGNYSRSIRRGLIVSFCLGWLKPYENQWLCYPPDVAKDFSPALADLVGYCQHRPNLGNFEGQCPSILLRGQPPEFIGAVDALRPEQTAELSAYMAGQPDAGPARDGAVVG
jgi:N-acyl-L-homoserine lactone synthetase